MGRRVFQLIVALMVSAMTLAVGVAPARADNASSLLGLVNALRATHGEAPLATDPTLTADAQAWSTRMASGYGLSDDLNLASQVPGGWTGLAENTGEGGNITSIFEALVGSPIHLANMLLSAYNLTGIGVAVGRLNTLWVTENFEARPGVPPVTTAPAPTTTTSPPTRTVPPATPPPTTPTLPDTTTPATAPPTATTTLPPDPTTVAGVGNAGPAQIADPPPSPPAQVPSAPDKLAVAAAVSRSRGSGGSLGVWVLILSLLGLALLAGAAFLIGRSVWR